MITPTALPDFFWETEMTPEAREAAVSAVIQGWNLQAVAKLWQDQIQPDLKARPQFLNVTRVYDGQIEAITKVCDNHIKGAYKEISAQVNVIFQSFIKIVDHFDQQGNINGVEAEHDSLVLHISKAKLDSEAIILASEARLKTVKEEWKTRMLCLEQNPHKLQARLGQAQKIGDAVWLHKKTVSQVEEIQSKIRNLSLDLIVMRTENTACKGLQARIEEIHFMDTHLLTTVNPITRKAFFEKNEEATPFFIFLALYAYVFGALREAVLPLFFFHDLRQEIQSLRRENPIEDLSVPRHREGMFLDDFKKFGSLRRSLEDSPTFKTLLKLSEEMLENKTVTSTFMEEFPFIGSKFLDKITLDTRRALFEKNEEATLFFIFFAAYAFALGYSRHGPISSRFSYNLMREIQRLRRENPIEDRLVPRFPRFRGEIFLADFKKFSSLRQYLEHSPTFKKLLKLVGKQRICQYFC